MINFTLLGKRIRRIRKEKGYTQMVLAEKSSISAQYLSQVENGKKQVSLNSLLRIAETLNVSIDDLLRGNQIECKMSYMKDISSVFDDCTSYEKRVLYEVISNMKVILRTNQNQLKSEIEKEWL